MSLKWIFRFIGLFLLQVLIFNKINLYGYIDPYVYILFLIVLPVNYDRYRLLAVAFFLGFLIDVFSNSGGIHTMATLLTAFIRPGLLSRYNKDDQDTIYEPSIREMGFTPFYFYAMILVLVHHTTLMLLDSFLVYDLASTLYRILLSAAVTLFFVLIWQFLFPTKKQNRGFG